MWGASYLTFPYIAMIQKKLLTSHKYLLGRFVAAAAVALQGRDCEASMRI